MTDTIMWVFHPYKKGDLATLRSACGQYLITHKGIEGKQTHIHFMHQYSNDRFNLTTDSVEIAVKAVEAYVAGRGWDLSWNAKVKLLQEYSSILGEEGLPEEDKPLSLGKKVMLKAKGVYLLRAQGVWRQVVYTQTVGALYTFIDIHTMEMYMIENPHAVKDTGTVIKRVVVGLR